MSTRDLYSSGLTWLWGQLRTAFGQSGMSATIQRRAAVRKGYTDTTPQWETVSDNVPCMLRPLRAEAVEKQGRDTAKTWVQIYFNSDPGVTRDKRIVIGTTYYVPVTTLELDSGSMLYRVDCSEIGA